MKSVYKSRRVSYLTTNIFKLFACFLHYRSPLVWGDLSSCSLLLSAFIAFCPSVLLSLLTLSTYLGAFWCFPISFFFLRNSEMKLKCVLGHETVLYYYYSCSIRDNRIHKIWYMYELTEAVAIDTRPSQIQTRQNPNAHKGKYA